VPRTAAKQGECQRNGSGDQKALCLNPRHSLGDYRGGQASEGRYRKAISEIAATIMESVRLAGTLLESRAAEMPRTMKDHNPNLAKISSSRAVHFSTVLFSIMAAMRSFARLAT
jgi:hypothetical protein